MLRDWKLHKDYQQELRLKLLLYQSIQKSRLVSLDADLILVNCTRISTSLASYAILAFPSINCIHCTIRLFSFSGASLSNNFTYLFSLFPMKAIFHNSTKFGR